MLETSRPVSSCCSLDNRIVNAHQFGVVRKRCFHLYLAKHFGDAFHDLIPPQELGASGHEFGNGFAVPCLLQDKISNQRDALGVVELYASCETSASDQCCERNHQLVFFAWREVHSLLRCRAPFSMTTSLVLGMDRDQTLDCTAAENYARQLSSRWRRLRQSERP